MLTYLWSQPKLPQFVVQVMTFYRLHGFDETEWFWGDMYSAGSSQLWLLLFLFSHEPQILRHGIGLLDPQKNC